LGLFKESHIELKEVGSSSKMMFQPYVTSETPTICIKKNKYENFVRKHYGSDIFCEEAPTAHNSQIQAKSKEEPKLIIRLRSPNTIFEYLGQVVRAQQQEHPYLVTLPPTSSTSNDPNGQSNQFALLVVNKDKLSGKSFASVEALDGSQYSISSENNGYSPTIIKLLAQFMTLQKIPGSIPVSPTVLIK
jgi:hypothetical protein